MADSASSSRDASSASPFAALCLVAAFHEVAAEPAALAHQLGLGPHDPVTPEDLLRAARLLGLKARLLRADPARLSRFPLPALIWLRPGTSSDEVNAVVEAVPTDDADRADRADDAAAPLAPAHAAVLGRLTDEEALIVEPTTGGAPARVPRDALLARWTGELLLVASRASLIGDAARFDFSWFIPALVKHRRLLAEVLLISFVLQGAGAQGLSTLHVVVIGLVVVMLFESLLSGLRQYILSHTTSRIDVELGARLFRHLAALPLAYFQARRVGDSVARVRELENIRAFLTGQALTVVLDLFFSVVFIAVMFVYSVPLTLIVLAGLPGYVLLSVLIVPVLRRRLDEKFARGAENQAMLVESVTAIQTVKAGAMEPVFARRWDQPRGLGHEGIGLIGKLTQAATLWWGAQEVMDGALTVGQFVAFNMFAQHVAQPVMRMANLWTDFQQTGLSMARLGDILNTRTEAPPTSAAQLPDLRGAIELRDVSFRYRPEATPALRGVDLAVSAGEVVGIVGRSGSGKSTLTTLVQRLHLPQEGRVLIDGVDTGLMDAAPASASDRRGAAGQQAVQPHAAREHRHRRSRRADRGRRARGAAGRQLAVRRSASAGGDRAGAVHRPAHPDPGRGHQRARFRERGGAAPEHGADLPRADGADHCPPAERGARGRPHRGAGARPRGGARLARRAAATPRRDLSTAVGHAGRTRGAGMTQDTTKDSTPGEAPDARTAPATRAGSAAGALLARSPGPGAAGRRDGLPPRRLGAAGHADASRATAHGLLADGTRLHRAGWSIVGEVDIVAIADGKLVVSDRSKVVQRWSARWSAACWCGTATASKPDRRWWSWTPRRRGGSREPR
ncbi:ABC transporter transmembrane region domain-containing protein [Ditylenchus destructor]|nr:ABC transporter transmembrane region domain-containing protein [Ditylenchus destructor]